VNDLVGRPDRALLGVAVAAFAAGFACTGWPGAIPAVLLLAAVGTTVRPLRVAAVVVAAAAASSALLQGGMPAPPTGLRSFEAATVADPYDAGHAELALVAADGYRLLATAEPGTLPPRGTVIVIAGVVTAGEGRLRGVPYSGRVRVRDLTVVGPRSVFDRLGNAVRGRVLERTGDDPGGALLAGFMVGDTARLDRSHLDAMRRSGLTHFVAVSGRNVALMLALWALVLGPLGWGPRRRIVLGLFALVVFAFATRFTPSVVRASIMAGFVLVGRLVGVHLTAWQALSAAVIAVSVAQPPLTHAVGFQLSAAATAGVLVGARVPEVSTTLGRAVAITAGAQIAVAPILLVVFGSVPLMAPVTNLLAAPLVALATTAGAFGVAGIVPLVALGETLSRLVLGIAHWGAGWPQVGWLGSLAMGGAGGLALSPRRRHWAALGVAAVTAAVLVAPPIRVDEPALVFLDVGQGDAVLILGGDGRAALFDGGPDPMLLRDHLRRYGVTRLDLVVISHSHHDHVAGLAGLFPGVAVTELWDRTEGHTGAEEVLALAVANGTVVRRPQPGTIARLGALEIEVLGPQRRYRSTNDQSIVLRVSGAGRSALLTGDVEAVGQGEIGTLPVDVLQVPHHGGATSDPAWLAAMRPPLAVISVGEDNRYGHPAPWVIDTLEQAGTSVLRTDRDGDVIVPLGVPDATVQVMAPARRGDTLTPVAAAVPVGGFCLLPTR
jgi:competence protein ComEC